MRPRRSSLLVREATLGEVELGDMSELMLMLVTSAMRVEHDAGDECDARRT
jgi:hypothetical protein